MTTNPGPLSEREVNRTVGALIDAAFDDDEEMAAELLAGGHPDLAACRCRWLSTVHRPVPVGLAGEPGQQPPHRVPDTRCT